MPSTIGEAYLQIRPSMEGVTGEIEQAMGDAGAKGASSFGASFGTGIKVLSGAAAAAVGAGAAGTIKLTQDATAAYADYEQLVGGVEVLFGETAQDVLDNASQAFATAGLSANDYMETVTGFAASLVSSLGENADEAANMADMAITDMADNANRMGTSMESIQNAYQGFAKGQFNMLDNLKLGYGGTQSEMERLLRDAEEMEGYVEGSFDLNNFSDVVEAIHIVQENMGIAGATADEAGSTISGSMASVKGALDNLVTGLADPNANLGALIQNVVATGSTALDNLVPTILNALQGIADALPMIVPIITEKLPALIQQIIPPLIQAISTLVQALVEAFPQILAIIIDVLPSLFTMIIETVLSMLPMIIDLGLQLIIALADGIIQALPTLIPAVVDVILTIVDKLTDPDTLVQLVDAALQLIIALATGLIEALPRLIEKAPEIVIKLAVAIIKALPKILEAGAELIFKLIEGIMTVIAKLVEIGAEIVDSVKSGFMEKVEAAKTWGRDMIQNFINGIKEKWEHLKSTVTDLASTIKSLLGFSEPDIGPLSNFHTFAPDMMELFAKGIRDNLGVIQSAMGMVTTSIANDFTSPNLAPNNYSPIVNTTDDLSALLGANSGAEGDIVIPVYIGQEKLDTIILNAQARHALVSGGR